MVKFDNDWDTVLEGEFEKPYYLKLREFLKSEYSTKTVFPSMYDIFNALKWTSYGDTRVVIIGQDPYHGVNQAHGLAFSVKKGVQIPPSLVNIYKELNQSLGCYIPNNGYLEKWARQGVLLLNASLTVVKDKANSHSSVGWEIFTDNVIRALDKREEPLIFLLWGSFAAKKASFINTQRHAVLTAPHPSPLSAHRGFFGCNHFKTANEILVKNGNAPIDWQIENI